MVWVSLIGALFEKRCCVEALHSGQSATGVGGGESMSLTGQRSPPLSRKDIVSIARELRSQRVGITSSIPKGS